MAEKYSCIEPIQIETKHGEYIVGIASYEKVDDSFNHPWGTKHQYFYEFEISYIEKYNETTDKHEDITDTIKGDEEAELNDSIAQEHFPSSSF